MKRTLLFALAWLVGVAAWAAPDQDDLRLIRAGFAREGLARANVEFAPDGRLRLTGQYRDRAEVQLAFHVAQQVAGVRWVAPTTPENVRYPGTEGMKSGILAALAKPKLARAQGGARGEIHALIAGVGSYATPAIPPIPNAADDARAFHDFLQAKGVPPDNMHLLLESRATKGNVAQALSTIRRKVRPEDTVVLFFSSHGNKPNDLGNTAVVLYDSRIDTQRRWLDPATALQDDEVRNFIEAVSPARVMVVLDVCYSGAAFAKIPGFLASTSKDLFVEEATFATGMGQAGLNYIAGSGRDQEKILIAASGPNEKSWSSPVLRHGYFTYYFLDALKSEPDVQKAFVTAKPVVAAEVRRVVSAEQRKEYTQTPQATFIPETANLKF